MAGVGAPEADTRELIGDVAKLDAAVGRHVHADPAAIAGDEVAAGRHPEALGGPARDRQVALDPAARIQKLRVDDRADRTVDVVVGEPLEQRQRARSLDVELAERGEVEEADALANRAVLDPDTVEEIGARLTPAPLIRTGPAAGRAGHEVVGALP